MTWLKRPRTPGVCCRELTAVGRRYGSTFTLRSPIFGDAVIVSGRSLVRDLFTTNGDLVARAVTILEAMNVRVLGAAETREKLALNGHGG